MKVGDLVRCVCEADIWYRGVIGVVIGFAITSDPEILYPNGKILRLAKAGLEVVSESR